MVISTDKNKIEEILNRGVEEVIMKEHLRKKLMSGKRLRIKFGIDPTSADLHIGHSIPLRKLKQFQDLGHQVILLIGDFTAQIGDPSGRSETRKILTEKEVRENMKDYTKQADKILDLNKVEIRYNSEWYKNKGIKSLLELSSYFTFARVIERDDFKERIKKDIDVSMLELYYPLLQGYDSVALKADVEVGGTDQKFNLLFGRKVQKKYKMAQQDIITTPLLVGTDGVIKMSKSVGNCVRFTEAPVNMFGKIMSIPDSIMWHYFKLLTDLPINEIDKIKEDIRRHNFSPRDAKARLAREIVRQYHGEKKARAAEAEFNRVFREKKLPSKMAQFRTSRRIYPLLDLLYETKLAPSKSEAKRLILGKGVRVNNEIKTDWKEKIKLKNGDVIRVGKLKHIHIVIKK